jgi:hypothetical protein
MKMLMESLERQRLVMYRSDAAHRLCIIKLFSQGGQSLGKQISTHLHDLIELRIGDIFEVFSVAGCDR